MRRYYLNTASKTKWDEFDDYFNEQWQAADELFYAQGIELTDRERDIISMLFTNMIAFSSVFREEDRKSTRLNSSHSQQSRMPSSA